MQSDSDYPLSAFREVLRTILGWSGVVIVMALLGIYLGYWIGHGEPPTLAGVATIYGLSFLAWLVVPEILVADATTLLIWGAPLMLNLESPGVRIAGAFVVLLVWTAVMAQGFL